MKKIKSRALKGRNILIVLLLIMAMVSNLWVFASADDGSEPAVVQRKLDDSYVSDIKNKYDLSDRKETTEYLQEIFRDLDIPEETVEWLSEEKRESFAQAEAFSASASAACSRVGNKEKMKKILIAARTVLDQENSEKDRQYQYTVVACYRWISAPLWRLTDTVGLCGINGAIINDSQEVTVSYQKDGEKHSESFDSSDEEYQGIGTSCIFEINLPNERRISDLTVVVGYAMRQSAEYANVSAQYFHKTMPVIKDAAFGSFKDETSFDPFFREYNIHTNIVF